MSPVMQAMVALVRHHGGAASVGRRVGLTDLSDQLSPTHRAKLGLDDAVMIELATNDFRMLRAHAEECRHFPPIPKPEGYDEGSEPCIQTMAQTAKEFADVVAAVTAPLARGLVTDADVAAARVEWDELMAVGGRMMAQLAALSKAAQQRAHGGAV